MYLSYLLNASIKCREHVFIFSFIDVFLIFSDGTGNNSDVWSSSVTATAQIQSPTTYTTYTNPSNALLTTSPNMTPNNFPPTNSMLTPENLVRVFAIFNKLSLAFKKNSGLVGMIEKLTLLLLVTLYTNYTSIVSTLLLGVLCRYTDKLVPSMVTS